MAVARAYTSCLADSAAPQSNLMAAVAALSKPPHFIVVGAQKSGTSSLHSILGAHPDVFIPDREIFFFDIDDPVQHPDFISSSGELRDFDADFANYEAWYVRFFESASARQVRGEDSTSYLSSTLAPQRIARLCPDVKIIALLRDPVSRAYSHYWHDVSRGRCSLSFDEAARDHDSLIVQRGYYREQLRRYHDAVGPDRLHVLVFEEFAENLERTSSETCDFLGLSPLPRSAFRRRRSNVARVPVNLKARLWLNRAAPLLVKKSYRGRLPEPGRDDDPRSNPWRARLWGSSLARHANSVLDRVRPRRAYPPMSPATRDALTALYQDANAGLDRLLGRDDLARWWPSWA